MDFAASACHNLGQAAIAELSMHEPQPTFRWAASVRIATCSSVILGLLALASCHSAPPEAAPQPVAGVPASAQVPAGYQAPNGNATLGDLVREDEWRQRTADKLRRNP